MGMLGKLLGSVIDVVTVPADLAKDVVTMGGLITDQEEPYTVKKVKRAVKKIEQSADDAADGDFL